MRVLYIRNSIEMESRKVGWGDPALVYDEQKDLFRSRDGCFTFSREHADWGSGEWYSDTNRLEAKKVKPFAS